MRVNQSGGDRKYFIIFTISTLYHQPSSHLYHTSHLREIPPSLAEARLPPSGSFQCRPIHQDFSSLLCSSWKFSSDTTVEIISTLAKLSRVLGVFHQGETEPIAWMVIFRLNQPRPPHHSFEAICFSEGVAGMLRTREDFRAVWSTLIG